MITHKNILIQFLNIYFVQPFDDVITAYQMEKTQIINHYPTLKSLSKVYWDKGLKGHYAGWQQPYLLQNGLLGKIT
ncbi:unnamed protein product [Paramecium primaurelia]|uniref:Uncharacterized protein n=1 Tax=Paramecium primaurelia TaxID=5886 RepID=A0A8S1PUL2_PARPR|nr:unnamed protein product [Paramecium primaurelia]